MPAYRILLAAILVKVCLFFHSGRIKTFAGSYICNKTEHTNSDKVVPRPCGPWELSQVKTTHAKTFKQHFYRRFIPQRSECFFRQVGTTNPRPFWVKYVPKKALLKYWNVIILSAKIPSTQKTKKYTFFFDFSKSDFRHIPFVNFRYGTLHDRAFHRGVFHHVRQLHHWRRGVLEDLALKYHGLRRPHVVRM